MLKFWQEKRSSLNLKKGKTPLFSSNPCLTLKNVIVHLRFKILQNRKITQWFFFFGPLCASFLSFCCAILPPSHRRLQAPFFGHKGPKNEILPLCGTFLPPKCGDLLTAAKIHIFRQKFRGLGAFQTPVIKMKLTTPLMKVKLSI